MHLCIGIWYMSFKKQSFISYNDVSTVVGAICQVTNNLKRKIIDLQSEKELKEFRVAQNVYWAQNQVKA